jgi:uracil-DNA glycosylase family 4
MFKELEELRRKCLSCKKCKLGGKTIHGCDWTPETGQHLCNVFSTMNPNVDLMVIGQNPGLDEVVAGMPFTGVSGQIFIEMLESITSLTRENVYVTNIVKCYTSQHRKPNNYEVDACYPYLEMEIGIVKPKVIVVFGSLAFKQLTGMTGVMKHCGDVVYSPKYNVPVVVLMHPSPCKMNISEYKKIFIDGLNNLAKILEVNL